MDNFPLLPLATWPEFINCFLSEKENAEVSKPPAESEVNYEVLTAPAKEEALTVTAEVSVLNAAGGTGMCCHRL